MALKSTPPDAEMLAIEALGFLAEEPERLSRFLALTGIEPASLRQAASEPHFLGSVLDYLLNDEALLLTFAANRRHKPESLQAARQRLGRMESDGMEF
jgi:Protein of unknown function (DUF3572)